jgi:hypothetical protein
MPAVYEPLSDVLLGMIDKLNKASGLAVRGNIDLTHRPRVRNKDGSLSTVRSRTFTLPDGRFVVLPSVGQNRIMSDDAVWKRYQRTGKHLGIFKTGKQAEKFADQLHLQQAELYKGFI